ncbi:MAG: 3-methyladenine DNA glycosylase [DPANN group archaeon]|nr:3-methyladenine DNA glycosylase [DPANN group archaeon]
MEPLGREFFRQDTVKVAKALIGKLLEVDRIRMRIVETEAYKDDQASHARTYTERSRLMFETYGHIYVYLVYGMYHCLNITTDEGPGAVLIRALDGEGCDGPGKLCRKLDITLKDNGQPLGRRFRILDDGQEPEIGTSERIGIRKDTHLRWRFYSKERQHPHR